MLLRIPYLIMPWKGAIYYNLQWYSPLGWWICSNIWMRRNHSICMGIPLSYCKPDLCWNTLYLEWNNAPLKEGRKWGSWSGIACHSVFLSMPDSATSHGQHVWYAQPCQVPKAANLPLLKAKWVFSLLYQHDHLASPLAWSMTEQTQKLLLNSPNKS